MEPFREQLLRELKRYRLRYPEETTTIRRLQEFVTTYADCFNRNFKIGHLTGSAWVMHHSESRVLLHHHRKLNKWLQFGGHADGETELFQVAAREASEESGISIFECLRPDIFDIDVHDIPSTPGMPAHLHFDVRYLFRAPPQAKFAKSPESFALKWVEFDEISHYTAESSIMRMIRKSKEFVKTT